MLDSFFLNPGGLIFLSLLIPLLLLYLIKPKPLRKTIPSLMFILSDVGKNNINRMFRNWVTDWLLLFHFIIILLLTLSVAQPYINVSQSVFVEESVIILDVSASMNIGDRWAEAEDLALDAISDRTTIILVQGFPELYADAVIPSRAKRLIKDLQPRDTTTNLADALKLVSAGPTTQVTIISDFLPSDGSLDIQPHIDALESKGAIVTKHVLGKPTGNIGLIDLVVRDDESKLWIKNYQDKPAEATVVIGDTEQSVLLAKHETKELSFDTPEGVTEITIKEDDDFMVDNTIWISTPTDNTITLLVFTNNKEKYENSNMRLAFDIIEKNFPITVETEFAVFPKVPKLNHDIYLFYDANPKLIIPGYIKDLKEQVAGGSGLIITAQNGLFGIDFQELLPVSYVEEGGSAEVVAAESNLLTRDIEFGQVQTYDRTEAKDGVTVVAQANDDPIITLSKYGQGTILYYGYHDGKESFSSENSYPVFWRRLFDLATNRPTLRSINTKTGSVVTFPKDEPIKTPIGKTTTRLLRTDDAGLYVLQDRTIAANLLSDLESNTMREAAIETHAEDTDDEDGRKLPKDLTEMFLLISLGFFFLELLYIKFRGDL